MRPRSAKAKGKRLQNKVTQLLQEKFSSVLEKGDFKYFPESLSQPRFKEKRIIIKYFLSINSR